MTRRQQAEKMLEEFQQIVKESQTEGDYNQKNQLEQQGVDKLIELGTHILLDFVYGEPK